MNRRLALAFAMIIIASPVLCLAQGAAIDDGIPIQPSIVPYIVMAIVTAVLNCVFTMAQTAISSLGPQAIEDTRKGTTPYDRYLKRFLVRLPQLELQFQIAALVMVLGTILLLMRAFVSMFQEVMGAGLSVFITLIVQLTLVEVVSRNIVLNNGKPFFRILVPMAAYLSVWVTPLMLPSFFFGAIKGVKRQSIALTDMHLRLLPSLSGVDRVIDEEAFDMIDSVREFAETTAEKIMTPRTQVFGISDKLSAAEIFEKLQETEYSRVVVYHETLDTVVGTLLAKEVLLQRPADPLSLIRKTITASENVRLPELLRVIRANRTHLVVLIDEYGGMSGIVTLHDLFERIVGHIEDVEDEEELWIENLGENKFRVNGRVELWEINEELNLELDQNVARTIAGYVFNSLGRIAVVGDELHTERATIRVDKSDEKMADILTIELLPAGSPQDMEEASGR